VNLGLGHAHPVGRQRPHQDAEASPQRHGRFVPEDDSRRAQIPDDVGQVGVGAVAVPGHLVGGEFPAQLRPTGEGEEGRVGDEVAGSPQSAEEQIGEDFPAVCYSLDANSCVGNPADLSTPSQRADLAAGDVESRQANFIGALQ